MKRVIIVHGYTGHPGKNWFPWLKAKLEELGHEVLVPAMPSPDKPLLSEWLPHLHEAVSAPDKDTYLVGHSLGCPTILRYIESLDVDEKIGGALLVAGFAEPLPHLPQLDSFTSDEWNDQAVVSHANNITILNSRDDKAVPFFNAEHVRDRFKAKLVAIDSAGHINEKSGHTQVPFVLNELKDMLGYQS